VNILEYILKKTFFKRFILKLPVRNFILYIPEEIKDIILILGFILAIIIFPIFLRILVFCTALYIMTYLVKQLTGRFISFGVEFFLLALIIPIFLRILVFLTSLYIMTYLVKQLTGRFISFWVEVFLLALIIPTPHILIDYKNIMRKRLAELSKDLSSKLKEIEFPKETKFTIEPSIIDLINLYFYNGKLKDIREVKSEAKTYLDIVLEYVEDYSFLPKRATIKLMDKIQDYNVKRILERTFEFINRYKDLLSENKKTYTYNEYLILKQFDTVIYNLDALWNFKINLRVLK